MLSLECECVWTLGRKNAFMNGWKWVNDVSECLSLKSAIKSSQFTIYLAYMDFWRSEKMGGVPILGRAWDAAPNGVRTSEKRREWETDWWTGAVVEMIWTLHCTVLVERELSIKAELPIYRSIPAPVYCPGLSWSLLCAHFSPSKAGVSSL